METPGAAAKPDRAQPGSTVEATTRRDLLKAGAGLAVAIAGGASSFPAPAIAAGTIDLPRAPNIVVLMTDQERHHMHWPAGWAEKNLPGLQRLKPMGSISTGPTRPSANARPRAPR